MTESLDFEGFTGLNLSLSGLLGLAILMVLVGFLIPRPLVNQIRRDRDARLAEAREENTNLWTAVRAGEERNALQAKQIGELLELSRTAVEQGKVTDAFIRSLQLTSKRIDRS